MKISVSDTVWKATAGTTAASDLIQKSFVAATLIRDRLGKMAEKIQVIQIKFVRKPANPFGGATDEVDFWVISLGAHDLGVSFGATSNDNDSSGQMAHNILCAMRKAISERIERQTYNANDLRPVLQTLENLR